MVTFSFKIPSFNERVWQCGASYTLNMMFKLFLLKEILSIDKGSICLMIRYKVY